MSAANATRPTALRHALRAREYFTLAFGTMVGVGWMLVIDDWLTRGGAAGAMLGFLIGGLALIPIALIYGRLTERIPDAASEIAYTAAVFPRGVSFGTGWMMTLAYLIVCPYEAVAIGRIGSYAVPQMNSMELYRVGGYPVYLPHLLAGLLLTVVIVAVNYRGIQFSARFQNLTTFGLLAIFAAFATLGFIKGDPSNWQPGFADPRGGLGVLVSTLMVVQIVPYFMTGFEAVPKCSEEASDDFDPRRFRRVILLALGAGISFYVTIIAVVTLIQPWRTLTTERFATAVAFERAFGSRALVQLIMFAVLLSLLKIFNGNFLTSTRLLFAMGRRGLLDARLASVDERLRIPKVAVIFVGCLTAVLSCLGQAVLVPISEVGSLAAAVGWLATSAAFCAAAGGVATSRRLKAIGYTGVAVAAMLIIMKVLPAIPGSFGRYEYLALGGWVAIGFLLWSRRTKVQPPPIPPSATPGRLDRGLRG
ncbi:MAG TPA: APC family permease [Blastocatellia bacterium]|nr:APC family permease [Blastocatellia bacterium]